VTPKEGDGREELRFTLCLVAAMHLTDDSAMPKEGHARPCLLFTLPPPACATSAQCTERVLLPGMGLRKQGDGRWTDTTYIDLA